MKTSKKFKIFLKKNWITLWLVLAVLIVGIISVSAAYTSNYYAKRVVSTGNNDAMLFSSNYLIYPSVVKTIQSNNAYIYICNYAKGNTRRRYSENLPYTLTAVLTNQSGTPLTDDDLTEMGITNISEEINKYKFEIDELSNKGNIDTSDMSFSKQADGSYAITPIKNTFVGGEECMDRYILTFLQDDENETVYPIYLKVIATPDINPMPNDLQPIEAIFGKKFVIDSEATIKWSGEFVDALTASNTKNFDAFNYRITGNGSGTFTLKWDTNYVELGTWAKEKLPSDSESSTDENGITTMTFDVGDNNISQYDIQFYRTANVPDSEKYGECSSIFKGKENNQNTVYDEVGEVKKPYVLFYFEAAKDEQQGDNGDDNEEEGENNEPAE